jgi:hypothetical protein
MRGAGVGTDNRAGGLGLNQGRTTAIRTEVACAKVPRAKGCWKKWLVHHRENIVCDVEGGQNLLCASCSYEAMREWVSISERYVVETWETAKGYSEGRGERLAYTHTITLYVGRLKWQVGMPPLNLNSSEGSTPVPGSAYNS